MRQRDVQLLFADQATGAHSTNLVGQVQIDALIRAKLKSNELDFAPEADRATLIRRATFDLTGLPPTPEEVDAFMNECRVASGHSALRIPRSAFPVPEVGFWFLEFGVCPPLHLRPSAFICG